MSILYKCSVIQFNFAVRCSNLSIPFICLNDRSIYSNIAIVRSIYSNIVCLKRPAIDFCGRTIHSELLDCDICLIEINIAFVLCVHFIQRRTAAMHFNPNRIGIGQAACRTSHRELSIDGELTIFKICIPILPNIHCIGRHRTRLADLQFGTCCIFIFVRITRHIDGICFNCRFSLYNERGCLIQLIDRIAVSLFCRRCIRTPSSDSKISPVRNARSFHRFFVPGRGITRQVKHRSIGYSEEPLILHQHIIYMCGTTIDSHLPLM